MLCNLATGQSRLLRCPCETCEAPRRPSTCQTWADVLEEIDAALIEIERPTPAEGGE